MPPRFLWNAPRVIALSGALLGSALCLVVVLDRPQPTLPPRGRPHSASSREAAQAFVSRELPALEIFPSRSAAFDRILLQLREWSVAKNPSTQARIERELEAALLAADARELVSAMPPEFYETPFFRAALQHWTRQNPQGALDWVHTQADSANEFTSIVIDGWVANDVAGLQLYLEALPAGAAKDQLLNTAILATLQRQMPELAVKWLAQLSPERNDLAMTDWAAQVWGARDLAAATAWAEAQEDGEMRERLLANVALGVAQSHPEQAIEFLRSHLRSPAAVESGVKGIVSTWAANEPQKAADWVLAFPEGELRGSALQSVVQDWSQKDAAAAQQWVTAQLTGPERDQSLLQIARNSSVGDWPSAARAVLATSPSQARNDMGTGIICQWSTTNFGEAAAWVNSLPAGDFQQMARLALTKR